MKNMKKKVSILTLHGMGETKSNYWFKLHDNIEEELGKEAFNQIHFEPIFYQEIIQHNQYKVWKNMPDDRLAWKELRQFLLYGFSDAAAIQYKFNEKGSVYDKIQVLIRDKLRDALSKLESPKSPVVLICQSLGCFVISDYLWDSQNDIGVWKHHPYDGAPGEQSFLKLNTTKYLFTTGCNIPIFTAGLEKILPFKKPNEGFIWENYFDKDDVLGWPLKALSPEYNELVNEDISINSGGLFTSWNPASHVRYWDDDSFIKPISRRIRQLVKKLQ